MAEETLEGLQERIRKQGEAKARAETEAAELRTKVAALEGELAPLKTVAARYEADSKAWASEKAFLAVGLVDPEAQDIARVYHERIPEAERPALDVWLKSVKADPAKAPRGLAPFLSAPGATGAAAGATPPAAGRPIVPPRVETAPAAGVAVSAEAIRAAYQQAMRTGDWKPYDGLKAQLHSERAQGR